MRLDRAGRPLAHVARLRHELFEAGDVEPALGRHAGDDADAAHRHVGVLVREQDGGADALVAAAGRVGTVDAGEDGDAHLLELGVPEEAGAAAAPVGVEHLLVGQLDAAAVHQPDERNVQALGDVGHPQNVLGLSGNPGARQHLVVETDDRGPPAGDLAEPVDDVGGAFLVVLRIVEAVQRAPASLVDQILEPLPDGERAALVDLGGRNAGFHARGPLRRDVRLDRFELLTALLRAGDDFILKFLAETRHRFKIRLHSKLLLRLSWPAHAAFFGIMSSPQESISALLSFVMCGTDPRIDATLPSGDCRANPAMTSMGDGEASQSLFGVKPRAMPEMMIFCTLEVPSTICSDLASR